MQCVRFNCRRLPYTNSSKQKRTRLLKLTKTCKVHSVTTDPSTDQIGSSSIDSCIPQNIKNNLAVLDFKNKEQESKVYIVGISHITQQSCDQVQQLIDCIQPEVVAIELCKDRIGFLVDAETLEQGSARTWHSRKITLTGVPDESYYPTKDELKSLIKSKSGRPLSSGDIEEDTNALLSTGLFRTVRPTLREPQKFDAPMFLLKNNDVLQTIPPLGEIEFTMQPRILPPIKSLDYRVDSSAQGIVTIDDKQVQEILDTIKKEAAEEKPVLECFLRGRQQILETVKSDEPIELVFIGVETGKVEILVRGIKGGSPLLTGLEETAFKGEGWGIEQFKVEQKPLKVGTRSFLSVEALDRLRQKQIQTINSILEEQQKQQNSTNQIPETKQIERSPKTEWRGWNFQEFALGLDSGLDSDLASDALSDFLTMKYAQYQGEAGEVLGVASGEAWRIALSSAVKNGAQQVLLCDRPASVTSRKLSKGILDAVLPKLLASGAFLAAGIAVEISGILSYPLDSIPFIASLALLATAIYPLATPILEIKNLSEQDAEEIERRVSVDEPILQNLNERLQLPGEDALLNWPGAWSNIIDERDQFIARTLFNAAKGDKAVSPAFIYDEVDGIEGLRYMIGEQGPNASCPKGVGDGAYKPIQGVKKIVAVVGSAHVRGIFKEWEKLVKGQTSDELQTLLQVD